MLRMHNQFVSTTPRKHLYPEWGFPRELVAGVRPEVVDCKYQWIPAEER
jgi:hypothetical protein